MKRFFALIVTALLLSGCGGEPAESGGEEGSSAVEGATPVLAEGTEMVKLKLPAMS